MQHTWVMPLLLSHLPDETKELQASSKVLHFPLLAYALHPGPVNGQLPSRNLLLEALDVSLGQLGDVAALAWDASLGRQTDNLLDSVRRPGV